MEELQTDVREKRLIRESGSRSQNLEKSSQSSSITIFMAHTLHLFSFSRFIF